MKRRSFFTGAVAGVASGIVGFLGLRKPAEAKQPSRRPRIVCKTPRLGERWSTSVLFGKVVQVAPAASCPEWMARLEGCDELSVWLFTRLGEAESRALLGQTVLLAGPTWLSLEIVAVAKDGAEIVSREDEERMSAFKDGVWPAAIGVDMASGQDSHHLVLTDRHGKCVSEFKAKREV